MLADAVSCVKGATLITSGRGAQHIHVQHTELDGNSLICCDGTAMLQTGDGQL